MKQYTQCKHEHRRHTINANIEKQFLWETLVHFTRCKIYSACTSSERAEMFKFCVHIPTCLKRNSIKQEYTSLVVLCVCSELIYEDSLICQVHRLVWHSTSVWDGACSSIRRLNYNVMPQCKFILLNNFAYIVYGWVDGVTRLLWAWEVK